MSARILVVDASRIVHQTVRLSLSDLAEITAVTNAADALAAQGPWTLALVSAEVGAALPGMVQELRAASPGIHLMVAVGVMRDLDEAVSGSLGPYHELRKPWVSRTFRARVEELLATGPAEAPVPEPTAAEALASTANMDLESSLAPPLNEGALQEITSPPAPVEGDSPFAPPSDLESFDEMPSTREFEGLIGDVSPGVSPMTELQAEAASLASELEAGLSALQASLEDFDEDPAIGTMPPAEARRAPELMERIDPMTVPPGGELPELGATAPAFTEDQTDDHDVLDDDEDEIEEGEPPVWPSEDTSEFQPLGAELPAYDEAADDDDDAASVIAALNALEAAAGVVEDELGMGDMVAPEPVAEELFAADSQPVTEAVESAAPVAAAEVSALPESLESAFAAMEAEPDAAEEVSALPESLESAVAAMEAEPAAAEEVSALPQSLESAFAALESEPSEAEEAPEPAFAPFESDLAAAEVAVPAVATGDHFDTALAPMGSGKGVPMDILDAEPTSTERVDDDFVQPVPVDTLDAEPTDSSFRVFNPAVEHPVDPPPRTMVDVAVEAFAQDPAPEPEPAAEPQSPLTPEQWIALRAEVRDTVEAMITELVPQIAERLIKDEIRRLTDGFE